MFIFIVFKISSFLMSALGRARRWVFTINNFTEDDENAVLALEQRDEVVSVIAEHEEGKEGTPHIQGYVVFDKAIYGNTVEKLLGGRAWLSVARGSTKANIEYCSKEGRIIVEKLDPMCESVLKKINFARDKDEWAKQRMEHMRTMTEEEFEEHYPSYYELHRERYRSFRMEHLIKHLETFSGSLTSKNIWIWGKPGIGKSRLARTNLECWQIYPKSFNKWWNGFDPTVHKRVVLDDYPAGQAGNALVQHMKIWGDRYPFTAEIKGGQMAIASTFQFIVTSNYPIAECFTNSEDVDAIERRFHEFCMTDSSETLDRFLVLSN